MTTEAQAALAVPPAYVQRSPLYFALRRFLANRAALGGGIVLLVLILAAIFAPLLGKTDPSAQVYLTDSLAFHRQNTGSASTIWDETSSPACSMARASR